MLEYPEARVLAKQIKIHLKGKKIMHVVANQSPHKFAWFNGDPTQYSTLLVNRTIEGAIPYGGMVEVSLGEVSLLVGDGTKMVLYPKNSTIPDKHQLLLSLDDHSSLVCSVQMYGGIWAYKQGAFNNPYYLGAKKAIPLTGVQFTLDYFKLKMDDAIKLPLKSFLATEQRFVGLGNGVLQDILWNAKLHPKTKVSALDETQKHELYQSIQTILIDMERRGGRNTETLLLGENGEYPTVLTSHSANHPCPRCGNLIIKESYMGGSIFYCPECQPFSKEIPNK